MNTNRLITRTLGATALAAALSVSAFAQKNVSIVGTSYSPTGADYTIFGENGITSSNPMGNSANVVLNFEFNPSIGAAYTDNKGKQTAFGIGLYDTGSGKNSSAASTGLLVQYNSAVTASSANLELMDFDINSLSKGFKTGKVEPALTLFGASGQMIGTATPDQVLASMTAEGKPSNDMWNLNLGTLLSNMGSSNTSVSKVLLFADSMNGEKTKSDPYLLKAVGNAQPVPEPASMGALAIGGIMLIRRRRKNNA